MKSRKMNLKKPNSGDKLTVCMIVPETSVKGGIAAVVAGYRNSSLEADNKIIYVESYCDGSKLAKLIKAIKGYIAYCRVLKKEDVDIVHVHSSFGPSFYRKIPFINIAYRQSIPVVNHIHGAEFETFFVNASDRKKKLISKIYNRCEVLIALSEEWKNNLMQIVSPEKICVIHNYSSLNEQAHVRYRDRLESASAETGKDILFLGELGHRKGVYDIIKIAKIVCEKDVTARFVLAGAGSDEDEANIKKLVHDNGLEKHIVFPGWVRGEEKDRLLQNAYLFFLPSYNEGMPMSVLDACGYGLPVVSTTVGGIPQIIDDGKSGYLHKPGDINGFAESILKLLSDKDMAVRMGECAFNIVEQNYSLKSHIEELENIWNRLNFD